MRRIAVILLLVFSFSVLFAQKRDINAWKSEDNLDQQFQTFKENLNFWNGSFFMKPPQIDEFYEAITDSIAILEKDISDKRNMIFSLEQNLAKQTALTDETQQKLDESTKNQNAIDVLGISLHKNVYTAIMSSVIFGLLVLLVVVFFMFKRSNKVTVDTKKDYEELKEEFETHKKFALERYTKINTELHQTRLELNKK